MRSKAGPRQLGDMPVIIYSRNLRGMSDSKEAELSSRLKSKRVLAACLQETHILGCKSWLNHGWIFIHNGLASRNKKRMATQGVAIVLGGEASDADVDKRIASATAAFGALKNIFNSKYLSEELKGEVYKALVLPTSLYGCEAWPLREDLLKRLRSFHNRCARSMCRVNLHHTFRHHITT